MNLETSLPDDNPLEWSEVYLVGIKGVGMAALAQLLVEAGVKVNGADVEHNFVTASTLHRLRVGVDTFEQATIPPTAEAVVYSGARGGAKNPLVQLAKKQKLPTYSLAQAVGMISQHRQTVAVAGVGGKSTTSSLLAWIMQEGGLNPSYAIGVGDIPNLGQSAHLNDQSDWLVVEADEYVADAKLDPTPRFLYLRPQHLICSSLTFDHPDVYQSSAETSQVFSKLFSYLNSNSWLVINGDDDGLQKLASRQQARVVMVGENSKNDVRVAVEPDPDGGGSRVQLIWQQLPGVEVTELNFYLPTPGFHNAYNAAYAAIMALLFGVSSRKITKALQQWRGVQRRFEYKGELGSGVKVFDDYAHHPREIAAMAQTIHQWFPRRSVVVAFEPHTYSRTEKLLDDFVRALSKIPGEIIILPIFSSARENQDDYDVSALDMVKALQSVGHNASYLTSYDELLQYVKKLPAGTLVFTLGAGDIYHVFDHVKLY